MLLVELHRLRVQPLRVLLVLLAQLGDLGGELALLDHGTARGHELKLQERSQQSPDDERDGDDRNAVRADRGEHWNGLDLGVDRAQQPVEADAEDRPPEAVDGQEEVEELAHQGTGS